MKTRIERIAEMVRNPIEKSKKEYLKEYEYWPGANKELTLYFGLLQDISTKVRPLNLGFISIEDYKRDFNSGEKNFIKNAILKYADGGYSPYMSGIYFVEKKFEDKTKPKIIGLRYPLNFPAEIPITNHLKAIPVSIQCLAVTGKIETKWRASDASNEYEINFLDNTYIARPEKDRPNVIELALKEEHFEKVSSLKFKLF